MPSSKSSSNKKTLQKKNNIIKQLRKQIKELDRRLDTLNETIMDEFDNRKVVSKRLDSVFTDVKKIQRDLDQDNERIDDIVTNLHPLKITMPIVKQVLKEQLGVNWANYGISHHQNIPRETTSTQSSSRRRRPPRV